MATITARPRSIDSPITASGTASPCLWGLSAIELHDRIWAARAVCVVRPGSQEIPDRGPGLYLLLGPSDTIDFSIAAAGDELFATRADALRVRVVGPRPRRHDEVIRRDHTGAFLGVSRIYAHGPAQSASCWVTASPDVANVWATLPARGASRQLKASAQCRRAATAKLPGTILNTRDETSFTEWLCRAAESCGRLSAVIPGAYHLRSDVWTHESASIGEGVRFAGPAMVGAGVKVPDGTTVIGPVILEDEAAIPTPAPVDWDELSAPTWRSIRSRRGGSLYAHTKRLFDIAASLVALAGLLVIAPVIMLLIYLEDGRPFFFAHTRQTVGGRNFPCFKFRTMVKDAERLKQDLSLNNQADGPQFFIKSDPRVLKVGHWLRRFQIDELPQFWNVLKGDMSIVGPRPSPDKENQFCPAWRDARLSVRPGVTGLWQVRRTRAPDTDFQEWIRYDLEYVQRRSWRLDLLIIVLTIRRVCNG